MNEKIYSMIHAVELFLLLCLFIMADPRPFIFKRKRGNNIEIQIMNFSLSPEILENHSHKMMKIIHFFRFLSMFFLYKRFGDTFFTH